MKNINNKSIFLGFKILSILAFAFMFIPFSQAAAIAPTYIYGHYNADGSYTYGEFIWNNNNGSSTNGINENPVPVINSISPRSSTILDTNTKTVTITGYGFTTSSIARINNSNRAVAFIDPTHLLAQINSNDIYTYQTNGGFYVTVWNGAPGGGYSNAVFFTINNNSATSATNTNQINGANNGTSNDTDKNYSNLASNAIFGSNSILPSGLMQWIIFAIIILIIVILARKVFGASKNYHETPLKHA